MTVTLLHTSPAFVCLGFILPEQVFGACNQTSTHVVFYIFAFLLVYCYTKDCTSFDVAIVFRSGVWRLHAH